MKNKKDKKLWGSITHPLEWLKVKLTIQSVGKDEVQKELCLWDYKLLQTLWGKNLSMAENLS